MAGDIRHPALRMRDGVVPVRRRITKGFQTCLGWSSRGGKRRSRGSRLSVPIEEYEGLPIDELPVTEMSVVPLAFEDDGKWVSAENFRTSDGFLL